MTGFEYGMLGVGLFGTQDIKQLIRNFLRSPVIIPIYIPQHYKKERLYVNNLLTSYTVISVIVFIVYFIFNPGI